MKKLGIIAYSTDTGLGNQTWEIYNHLHPDKVLLVDLYDFNKVPTHHERYPGARIVQGYPTSEDCEWLTSNIDTILVCETPLNYDLFQLSYSKALKVIHQYNYEFLDYFKKPHLPRPTILAAPSAWNTDIIRKMALTRVEELPVPINRSKIPFRQINECKTFVHIIGRPAIHDRNGTLQFLEAIKILKDTFRYRIYYQPPSDRRAVEYFEPVRKKLDELHNVADIRLIANVDNYADMYSTGDVLVLPRKYGGLCLPMQEALSAGMPVLMTNISPNYTVLPTEWLIRSVNPKSFMTHINIDYYEADVHDLIYRMLQFIDRSFMEKANKKANLIAESLSWSKLLPRYQQLINE